MIGGTCGVSPCLAEGIPVGCGIPIGQTENYLRRATRAPQMSTTGEFVIEPRSGDSWLDYAFAQALGNMARTFEVLPGFTYYNDSDGPNAKATPRAMLERSDGTVLFGLRFLRMLLDNPVHGEAGVLAFAAHEFGHIVSFKNGMIGPLTDRLGTFGGEQFADYMSGYFAGKRKRLNADYRAVAFATTIGDYAGGPHGDRVARTGAIQAGFVDAYQHDLPIGDATQAAYRYIMGP